MSNENDPSDGGNDDFWGDDGPSRPRRERSGASGGQTKALPIVAAAAALLLIVVIFVASRSSDSSKKTTGSGTTTTVAGAPTGGGATSGNGKTTTTVPKKKTAKWNNGVVGAPAFFRGPGGTVTPGQTPPPGVYIWNDFSDWHIRVVKGPGVTGVKGGLLANKPLIVKSVIGGAGNTATATDKTINFALSDSGDKINGLDFKVGSFGSSVVLRIDTGAGAGAVHLGSAATVAPTNPITFQKVVAR